MRRTRRLVAVFLVVVLVAAPVGATATGSFGGVAQQSIDPDVVLLTADVQADGDAEWTVAYRIRLADDNETQAFENLQADIAANRSAYTDRFGDRMARTARTATNATGREMAIENVTVETRQESLGQTYGVVTYRFRWTNFAMTDDGRMVIGDALGGLFLDSETSLTIAWPSGYASSTILPDPDERTNTSATWTGQQQFRTDGPRVVAIEQSTGSGFDPVSVGALAVVMLALVVVVYVSRRSGLFDSDDLLDASEQARGRSSVGSTYTVGSETTSTDTESEDPEESDTESNPPQKLLSNEEQVLQLVSEHGGRIKQQQVASELEWTDAKTSQVIGGLREEDELETFRIGRENVVTFPDTDLTETDDESEGDR